MMQWHDARTGTIRPVTLLVMAVATYAAVIVFARLVVLDHADGRLFRAMAIMLIVAISVLYGMWALSEWTNKREYLRLKTVCDGLTEQGATTLAHSLAAQFAESRTEFIVNEGDVPGNWRVDAYGWPRDVGRMRTFAQGWIKGAREAYLC